MIFFPFLPLDQEQLVKLLLERFHEVQIQSCGWQFSREGDDLHGNSPLEGEKVL